MEAHVTPGPSSLPIAALANDSNSTHAEILLLYSTDATVYIFGVMQIGMHIPNPV